METVEQRLLNALLSLEQAVAEMSRTQSKSGNPGAAKPNLLPLFEQIDGLTAELPHSTDATLLHYLHKRSYQKARLYLEGRESENKRGNCGHV